MAYKKPDIDYNTLDPGVRDMVRYFNEVACLPTRMSCSGHPGTSMKFFWIEFGPDVTDADIWRFMDQHTADWTGFTAHGWFCRRFLNDKAFGKSSEIPLLAYVAPDQAAADADLRLWIHDDASGSVKRDPRVFSTGNDDKGGA